LDSQQRHAVREAIDAFLNAESTFDVAQRVGWPSAALGVALLSTEAANLVQDPSGLSADERLDAWLTELHLFADPEDLVAWSGHAHAENALVSSQPGMASEMMQLLQPFLQEEGVDIDTPVDIDTLQAALSKASERYNMELFTPVGANRESAASALDGALVASVGGRDAQDYLAWFAQENPDAPPWVIGLSAGMLDRVLGPGPDGPKLVRAATPPAAYIKGPNSGAVIEVLDLAIKGRAHASIGALIRTRGGQQVYESCALAALAVTLSFTTADTTSRASGIDLLRSHLRKLLV
jgi:hypothetical protein